MATNKISLPSDIEIPLYDGLTLGFDSNGNILISNNEIRDNGAISSFGISGFSRFRELTEVRDVETALGSSETDLLVSRDNFPKTIYGLEENDIIFASVGPTNAFGNQGDDNLQGGLGNDTIYGGKNSDSIGGNGGNDHLFGDKGIDSLDGGEGNDWLNGGEDFDLLKGGSGFDTLEVSTSQKDFDVITGLEDSQDLIALKGLTFEEITITQLDNNEVENLSRFLSSSLPNSSLLSLLFRPAPAGPEVPPPTDSADISGIRPEDLDLRPVFPNVPGFDNSILVPIFSAGDIAIKTVATNETLGVVILEEPSDISQFGVDNFVFI